MAAVSIAWGDGTSDVITVNYSGMSGSSQMTVASDPNKTVNARTKVVNLKVGSTTIATLTVKQNARSRAYSAAYGSAY
jgi:hypothetical protein